jgi:predicted nucleic acid-binding protein
MVLSEFLFGISQLPRAKQNLNEWRILKSGFLICDTTEADAYNAAELRLSMRRNGRQLQLIDAHIAVTALRFGVTLLTADRDFISIPGLQLDDWVKT